MSDNKKNIFYKMKKYYCENGTKQFIKRLCEKITRSDQVSYEKWLKRHLPSENEMKKQREFRFKDNIKISIVVPLYKTPAKYLRHMVASVRAQTYTNWELILSDGSGKESKLKNYISEEIHDDERIVYINNKERLDISENTNVALNRIKGDYVAFMDHDDLLTPDALFECALAINEDSKREILYSDEDKISMDGKDFFQPHFKTDFNIDLLCSMNYFCHLFVVKKDILDQAGLLRKEYNGAQDYDLVLRCVEIANKVYHIPRVLYHWRAHRNSTAENPESKLYAFDAGRRAIEAHYERIGIKAQVIQGEYLGLYRTKFLWDRKPLVSIIIPNKDHVRDLDKCINSIEKKSIYRNFEYIIVENNSKERITFRYYEELQKKNSKVKVVEWKGEFNYSAINNYGVTFAKGEYLLLLNNDTEIINEDCLDELLGYCMKPDVGVVGARLYYKDDTIQHAGVIVGFGGIAGHAFLGLPRTANGYFSRIICAQDLSAVTAACMMVKRSVFEEVEGFDVKFKVAFNDIDFCMKVGKAGKLVVYNPYAELYHYESKTRGLEDTEEKVRRFNSEIERFAKKWPGILKKGDPFYSPNLSIKKCDFSIRSWKE